MPVPGHEEDARLTRALREALGCLPVPEVSSDFDARVLAAHARRAPCPFLRRWLNWPALRPVLGGAACSLVVTLALSAWSARLPLEVRARRGGLGTVALERVLDVPDLSAGSLARSIAPAAGVMFPPSPLPRRRSPGPPPRPGRRSQGRSAVPHAA
jgi:hypothetical protein